MDIRQTRNKQKQLNSDRTPRQREVVKKWKDNNWKGIFIAATGFGKTYTAILAILDMKPKDVTVVVPTLELQIQWQSELKRHKVKDFRVIVINTASTMKLKADLLIFDECHRLPAEKFRLALTNAHYNGLFMLTATMKRQDGEHKFLLTYTKVIDTISVEECLKNGWISNYTIYNLSVPLAEEEREAYEEADEEFTKYAKLCGGKTYAFKNANIYLKQSKILSQTKKENKIALSKNEYFNWRKANKTEHDIIERRAKLAVMYYNWMGKRKQIIYDATHKLSTTYNIIQAFPDRKTLVFSLSTDFADQLQEMVGDTCVTIHSKMTKKQRQESLRLFNDNRTKKRVISSVKALNSGLDIPECEIGVAASATSSEIEAIQSLGRVVRAVEGKHAIFVNLYVEDTQDTIWLKNRQWKMDKTNIRWIHSVSQITV